MKLLDKKLMQRVQKTSKELGLPEQEVISRAVFSYLGSIEDIAVLYRELRMWDALSARSMRKHNF
ncbi:hypothetical protein A2852_02660 [Candidatus Adlerbacteria bacterium RIFCSPHIGHO2_01_FULL_54_23]|uniref:Uncharacterized protein n=3 Tax=Candidatus Adleribacteriota TaxID=1752736 RepID=A0A0G1YT72_9BACT|nr:MAG: hypothetical protein UY61_C0089G0005 [Candidatus Adlerbacteria bacterium GW2011_GWC1_50_9]KKW35525.1 MAG: hypothetical protein UY83_C0006G0002 [Candidatus Adlerbacteria bacterium GW2011_GWA1_54_10]OGC79496.1 MAG: hypothetical protein A2852_02660 [Candidatus Adlerbacteria bacterium RIFCSPHIGHO2_01_FULL_54_23]OGC87144.1 MAG: hypothetical protein A3B33_01020 [Candidatus Adlerbacteria bacterium RIFCSPLOWO2_01_FULL_54_16]